MGKREFRMSRLIGMVREHGYLPIKEAAAQLSVSEMTVRRDISEMEPSGFVKNVNGVLVACTVPEEPEKSYNLESEGHVQNEAKTKIGQFAARLIEPGESVILDTGSTTEKIAESIPQSLEFEAICFTFNTFRRLQSLPKASLSLAGGFFHPDTQMFTSGEGVEFIQNIRANKVFVSAAGVHDTLGISCANSYEVPTKRAILKSARQHILVADSSKFGVVRSSYFCDLSDIHTVITDVGLSEEWQARLQNHGITVYLV